VQAPQSDGSSEPNPTDPAAASPGHARYALGVLVAVYVFNMVDRNILNVLLEHIKAELGASDLQLGLLVGPAFAIFYAVAGLPIARLADRHSRRMVISLGLAVWSLMTAVSALVRSYPQLLLARIGVGVGEASCSPAAHSLISDYFPPERRGTAFAIYAIGAPLGAVLGFLIGGWVTELFSWRGALMVVGLPGVVFAGFVWLTLREPVRGIHEKQTVASVSMGDALRFMARLPALRHVLLGASVHAFASVGVGSWHAPFLMRVHEMGAGEAGSWMALLAVGSAIGTYVGGKLSDRLGRRDVRWNLWATGAATLAAVPFYLGFYFWPSRGGALAMAIPAGMLAAYFTAPTIAMTQALVRPNMRALASAVMLFLANMIGTGLGPLVVGAVSDALTPEHGRHAIRYALLIVVATNLWASIHFFLGARTLRRDLTASGAD
jgi:MFS family permease